MDDILVSNGGFLVKNGDLVVGDSTIQESVFLLRLEKGGLKYDPINGVHADFYLKRRNKLALIREIHVQFRRDQKNPGIVEVRDNKIKLGIDERV
jgi:hypothetical protein